MENFDFQKVKIETRVRELFLQPVRELCQKCLEIPEKDRSNFMAIYWQFCGENRETFRQECGKFPSIFPGFSSALDGDFSEKRVRYLAEFILSELKELRIRAENSL